MRAFGRFVSLTTSMLVLATYGVVCLTAACAQSAPPLYVAAHRANSILRITFAAPGAMQSISTFAVGVEGPRYMAFDRSGNLYVTTLDFNNPVVRPDQTVEMIAPDGTVQTLASGFITPYGLAFDRSGNLYVADTDAGIIYRAAFSSPGVMSSLGVFAQGLTSPFGLAFSPSGELFVSHFTAGSIGRITFSTDGSFGGMTTFASGLDGPTDMAFDGAGNLYVAETGRPGYASGTSVAKIGWDGTVTTLVNGGGLSGPVGLAMDSAGSLYVSNAVSNITGSWVSRITFSAPGAFAGVGTFADGIAGPFGLAFPARASDATPPTTTATLSGPQGDNGWYKGDVQVTLSAADPDDAAGTLTTSYALDGGATQAYRAPFTVSGDKAHTVAFWSVDSAGNGETPHKTQEIKIDATPSGLDWGAASPTANVNGWNNAGVDVPFTTGDNLSGVASSDPVSPLHFAAEGKDQTQAVTVKDNAGNSATFTSARVSIDLTAPVITITTPADLAVYLLHQTVTASFAIEDALSGVDLSSVTGTAANGSTLDTSAVGSKQFEVTARDLAGNGASMSVTYAVAYGVAPLYDQTRLHRSGSTVPVKLQLIDAAGSNVSCAAVTVRALSVVRSSDSATGTLEDSGNANPDLNFRYDATLGGSGGYIYNLSLKGYATGTYLIHFSAGSDPTDHTLQFQVK